MQSDFPFALKRMQLWVGIGTVSVARSPRTEHHIAAIHCALMHLAQVNSREMDLQGAFVAERLEANVALCPFFAGDWMNILRTEVRCDGRRWWGRFPLAWGRLLVTGGAATIRRV